MRDRLGHSNTVFFIFIYSNLSENTKKGKFQDGHVTFTIMLLFRKKDLCVCLSFVKHLWPAHQRCDQLYYFPFYFLSVRPLMKAKSPCCTFHWLQIFPIFPALPTTCIMTQSCYGDSSVVHMDSGPSVSLIRDGRMWMPFIHCNAVAISLYVSQKTCQSVKGKV